MSATTRSDAHAVLASEALEGAGDAMLAGRDQLADQLLKIAGVRAQLALVEEQRTANLIALFNEQGPEVFRPQHTGLPESASDRAVEAAIRAKYLELADVVRERVGLA